MSTAQQTASIGPGGKKCLLEDNVIAYKTEAGRRNSMGPHPTPDFAPEFMVRAGKARFDSHPDHPKR